MVVGVLCIAEMCTVVIIIEHSLPLACLTQHYSVSVVTLHCTIIGFDKISFGGILRPKYLTIKTSKLLTKNTAILSHCFSFEPSLNTQSCIKRLLVVQDLCFWAIWAAGPVQKKKRCGPIRSNF